MLKTWVAGCVVWCGEGERKKETRGERWWFMYLQTALKIHFTKVRRSESLVGGPTPKLRIPGRRIFLSVVLIGLQYRHLATPKVR